MPFPRSENHYTKEPKEFQCLFTKTRPFATTTHMNKELEWLLNEKYGGIKTPDFERDTERLLSGEPLAYVIGWVPFLGTKIHLDSRPLIPRPETEFWVSEILREMPKEKTLRVLDLCAGSGCIGVAIAHHLPHSHVDFAELIDDHHQTIRKNIRENNIDVNRTKQIGGNLFEHVTETYDLILSNPPYINQKLSDRIEPSVKAFEPTEALFGGDEGMEILKKIIEEAPRYLHPGGMLVIEHEPEQTEIIKTLAAHAETFKDQFGIERYTKIQF